MTEMHETWTPKIHFDDKWSFKNFQKKFHNWLWSLSVHHYQHEKYLWMKNPDTCTDNLFGIQLLNKDDFLLTDFILPLTEQIVSTLSSSNAHSVFQSYPIKCSPGMNVGWMNTSAGQMWALFKMVLWPMSYYMWQFHTHPLHTEIKRVFTHKGGLSGACRPSEYSQLTMSMAFQESIELGVACPLQQRAIGWTSVLI